MPSAGASQKQQTPDNGTTAPANTASSIVNSNTAPLFRRAQWPSMLSIVLLRCACSKFGDVEGLTEVLRTDKTNTPRPTPKPTLKSYTAVAKSCTESRSSKNSKPESSAFLGPLEARRCTNILQDMQNGEWVYGMDHICKSPEARLNVLCSNTRDIGELSESSHKYVYQNKPGAVWRPKHCKIKIFTAAEACALLTKIGRLTIAGESLQRHTYQGTVFLMS